MDKDADWKPQGSPFLPRYPTEFKKTVVLYAEKFSNREAERTFGIAESNIRRWKKLKSTLFSDGFASDSSESTPQKKNIDDSLKIDQINQVNELKTPKKEEKDPEDEEVCLRWNSHHDNMKNMFPILLKKELFVDVTLSSGKKTLKCHKIILSACSSYFENMLADVSPLQHVIIFMNTIPFWLLEILINFMYTGEVHIQQSKLQELLEMAETLQIKGLAGKSDKKERNDVKNKEENINKSVNIDKKNQKLVMPEESKMDVKPILDNNVKEKNDNTKKKLIKPQLDDSMPVLKPIMTKKMVKKRKSCEKDSTPPILYRKGTKSRPQVKVPRYYHNEDYDHDDLKPLRNRSFNPNEIDAKKDKDKDKEKKENDENEKMNFSIKSPLEKEEIKIKTENFDDANEVVLEIPPDEVSDKT